MSERLSPERLAEIRKASVYSGAFRELLDHADAQQAEIDRLTEWRNAVSGAIKTAPYFESGEWGGDKECWGYHVKQVDWLIRETDRIESQAAVLREALSVQRACDASGACSDCQRKQAVLADTEAAAKAHDQRERLAGAREYDERLGNAIDWDTDTADLMHDVLAGMEREAGQ